MKIVDKLKNSFRENQIILIIPSVLVRKQGNSLPYNLKTFEVERQFRMSKMKQFTQQVFTRKPLGSTLKASCYNSKVLSILMFGQF